LGGLGNLALYGFFWLFTVWCSGLGTLFAAFFLGVSQIIPGSRLASAGAMAAFNCYWYRSLVRATDFVSGMTMIKFADYQRSFPNMKIAGSIMFI
jgi:hypothetical protein